MAEPARPLDTSYELADRYRRRGGRVYLSGVQALVRLPLMQRQRDAAAGLATAGFISGYRGSPLGSYDLALGQAQAELDAHDVVFQPGVNEDLAATAVWGSQQAGLYAGARHEGVFGIWYGKGPGVDRSCDALKHANYAGTAPRGGVLALCGDDPAARSSSIAHQSEHALVHCGIPLLHPADVQEYLDLGLLGLALSRHAGCWVGMKCVTDTVDSARSVAVDPERVRVIVPEGERPENLHVGWTNIPLAVERRLFQQRLPAAHAFVRVNAFDRVVWPAGERRLGIVTTGKAYHDVMQALAALGIDRERAAELGLEIYKVALVWPLEPEGVRRFAAGLEDLLVVEEKRPFLEEQLARILYNEPERPRLLGKQDEHGAALLPAEGELAPAAVAAALRSWLTRRAPELSRTLAPLPEATGVAAAGAPLRLPAFCAGCPHNTSTNLPEGSLALGGIGCHGMAVWLPERRTLAVTQMGGEGANWIGAAPFTDTTHVFQNLGDGTYFHSGLLAVRAAVTAGVNLTYKVLANGAVAMTGGQRIEGESLEGEVAVPDIVRQLAAEGVGRIDVLSDQPGKYPRGALPKGVQVHHRRELERVQRELRGTPGVTALVYDQTCAAEARRLRKRGELPEPERRIVINELVCEGCGDCSVQSNCIAIEPLETEFGRKRRIDQSACNKDYSCVLGYCPSFASVTGGRLRRRGAGEAGELGAADPSEGLPEPCPAPADPPWNVLLAGIGGGGVVTAGALLGMAAHLEGRGCSVLDVTGLAQKNGPVTSHVRIADDPDSLHATRVGTASADLLLALDPVVACSPEVLGAVAKGRTRVLVDTRVAPTFEFAHSPDLDLSPDGMLETLRSATGDALHALAASRLAGALLGDTVAANLFLLGFALQQGLLPVSRAALERAIELNGRAVAMNQRALAWGRRAAVDRAAVEQAARLDPDGSATPDASLEALVARRAGFLTDYQSRRYARRYELLVERCATRERELLAKRQQGNERPRLAEGVARGYFKLLAYKDEYEVARLWTDGSFRRQLEREFEGDYRLQLHLAPQLANRRDAGGRASKWALGPWAFRLLGVLKHGKRLRGTPLDPFGWTAHRRFERRLIGDYERLVEELLAGLTPANHALAVELAELPERMRGYDTIKERNVRETKAREHELLAAFRGDGV